MSTEINDDCKKKLCMLEHVRVCVCMHVGMCVCVWACLCMWVSVCVCVRIHRPCWNKTLSLCKDLQGVAQWLWWLDGIEREILVLTHAHMRSIWHTVSHTYTHEQEYKRLWLQRLKQNVKMRQFFHPAHVHSSWLCCRYTLVWSLTFLSCLLLVFIRSSDSHHWAILHDFCSTNAPCCPSQLDPGLNTCSHHLAILHVCSPSAPCCPSQLDPGLNTCSDHWAILHDGCSPSAPCCPSQLDPGLNTCSRHSAMLHDVCSTSAPASLTPGPNTC